MPIYLFTTLVKSTNTLIYLERHHSWLCTVQFHLVQIPCKHDKTPIVHSAPATTSTLLTFTQHYQMILYNARGQALYRLKKCPDMKLHIYLFWCFIWALLTAAANLNLLISAWADAQGCICNQHYTYVCYCLSSKTTVAPVSPKRPCPFAKERGFPVCRGP